MKKLVGDIHIKRMGTIPPRYFEDYHPERNFCRMIKEFYLKED